MKDINALLNEKFKNKDFEKQYHRIASFDRLADKLLLLRKKRGITQKELAEKVGTTQAVVSRLENATVKPSMETIIKIAEALDAAVDVLLLPFEEQKMQMDENDQTVLQKQQDALKGIDYFQVVQISDDASKWMDAEKFSTLLSISGRPSLAPISKTKKIREFA